jgi:hypothetical protein
MIRVDFDDGVDKFSGSAGENQDGFEHMLTVRLEEITQKLTMCTLQTPTARFGEYDLPMKQRLIFHSTHYF